MQLPYQESGQKAKQYLQAFHAEEECIYDGYLSDNRGPYEIFLLIEAFHWSI